MKVSKRRRGGRGVDMTAKATRRDEVSAEECCIGLVLGWIKCYQSITPHSG